MHILSNDSNANMETLKMRKTKSWFVNIKSIDHWNPVYTFKFVILFVCGFSSHSRTVYSFGNVIITDKVLQILTYARHSWPLRIERFFSVPNLWNVASVYNVNFPKTLDEHTCCKWQWNCHFIFFCDVGLSRLGIQHQNFRIQGNGLNLLSRSHGFCHENISAIMNWVEKHAYCIFIFVWV